MSQQDRPQGYIPYRERNKYQKYISDKFADETPVYRSWMLGDIPDMVITPALEVALFGKILPRTLQLSGSCVGAGGSNAYVQAQVGDVYVRGDQEEVKLVFPWCTYGVGREIAGLGGPGEGSFGAAQSEACKRNVFGILPGDYPKAKPPLKNDGKWVQWSASIEKDWSWPAQWKSRCGVSREELEVDSKKFGFATVTQCKDTLSVRQLLAQGYGITCASMFGTRGAKVDGEFSIAPYNGSWAHQQCFDKNTEILTGRGWISVQDITTDDTFATLDPHTHRVEYQKSTALHIYDYSGPMYHFGDKVLDLLVTPNHRIYSANKKSQRYNFQEAQHVQSGRMMYRASEGFSGGANVKTYRLSDKLSIPMELWLEFLGFWIAEGTCYERTFVQKYEFAGNSPGTTAKRSNGYVCLTQGKPDGIAYCDDLVSRFSRATKTRWSRHVDSRGMVQWRCYSKVLRSPLLEQGKQPYRYIPEYIFGLAQRLQQIVLDALWRGDGCESRNCYYSTSRQLANDVSRLLLHCGYGSSVRRYGPNQGKSSYGGKRPMYCVARYTSKQVHSWNKEVVDYTGKVYCVTVPNETVMVRRNGKTTVWTGNSICGYAKHSNYTWLYAIQNQWGPSLDIHPTCPTLSKYGVEGAYWITEDTFNRILSSRDSEVFGHSATGGFPVQTIDWTKLIWDYHD